MKVSDIIGNRYSRLTVIERSGSTPNGDALWLCQCDCGNSTRVVGSKLRSGRTRSCGCLQVDVQRERFLSDQRPTGGGGGKPIHGHAARRSPTYRSWAKMKDRCQNPNEVNYSNYGGRGVTVCDRWLSFENFLADMGERPEGMTLDRIDPWGNYEPDNCRWATREVQRQNVRKNEHGMPV